MTETIKGRTAMPYVEDDPELAAMAAARQREYETSVLLDRALGLDTLERGNDLMAAAARDLKSRGVAMDDASQEQLLDALRRVSS